MPPQTSSHPPSAASGTSSHEPTPRHYPYKKRPYAQACLVSRCRAVGVRRRRRTIRTTPQSSHPRPAEPARSAAPTPKPRRARRVASRRFLASSQPPRRGSDVSPRRRRHATGRRRRRRAQACQRRVTVLLQQHRLRRRCVMLHSSASMNTRHMIARPGTSGTESRLPSTVCAASRPSCTCPRFPTCRTARTAGPRSASAAQVPMAASRRPRRSSHPVSG